MTKTLIIVEPTEQLGMIQSLLSASLKLEKTCDICLIGTGSSTIAKKIKHKKISEIFTINEAGSDQATTSDIYLSLKDQLDNYTNIVMAATSFGRSCIPYIAGKMMKSPVTDIIQIESPSKFKRPIYAGNAIQNIENLQSNNLLTVRTTSFSPCEFDSSQHSIKPLPFIKDNRISAKDNKIISSDRPDLMGAKIVVSGGAGVGSKDNFNLLESLADNLGAAIGASRAAVDAGYVPNDHQVGQTGKIIAPEVYIAVGISGAIQHMAGMKDSRTIIAINNDADAPIFKVADIGFCGDLFDILPEMIRNTKK